MNVELEVARRTITDGETRGETVIATALIAIAEELHRINVREDERDDLDDRRREADAARRQTWNRP